MSETEATQTAVAPADSENQETSYAVIQESVLEGLAVEPIEPKTALTDQFTPKVLKAFRVSSFMILDAMKEFKFLHLNQT